MLVQKTQVTEGHFGNILAGMTFFKLRTTFVKTSSSSVTRLIVGKWDSAANEWFLYSSTSDSLKFLWYTTSSNRCIVDLNTTIALNEETDVELTYDGSLPVGNRVSATVNGSPVTATSTLQGSPTGIATTSANLAVGVPFLGSSPTSHRFPGYVTRAEILDQSDATLLLWRAEIATEEASGGGVGGFPLSRLVN